MTKLLAMSVFLGVGTWLASACVVGDSTLPGATPDAAGDASGDGAPGDGPGGGDGSQANCEPAQTPTNGHHNPGQSCQVGGCHLVGNTGGGAPAFYASGTLYNNANGTSPVSGATIVVVSGAVTHKLVTAANGNFYLETAANPPFTTKASKCPDETPMIAPAATGDCNSCHQVGDEGRIHLP